jgi:transglutaminase-like putative cysteine protease
MTRPAGASAPGPGRAAAATALLVGTGAASWSWVLRGSLVGVALMLAVAAVAVLLAAGRLSYRPAAVLLAVCLAAAVWAAGAPAGQLPPSAWPSLPARLVGGAKRLATPGSGPIATQPWPLAAWLLGAGAVWVAGAALATSGPSSARRRVIAFGVLAVPWTAAVAARQGDRAAWQGATVLLAGLLWFTARRVALRRVLALGLAAALLSVATAQAVGPRTRWFTPPSPSGATVRFPALETELTYGPLQGQRSGATMFEVTAAQPALWRMRVLSLFAGPGWRVADSPPLELPQPAAEPVEVTVRVRGLGNDLVVAPGRIDAVHARGTPTWAPGEAWQLTPPPRRGVSYRVRASVVRATTEQLQAAPMPTDPRLHAYTSLIPGYVWPSRAVVPLLGQPPDPRVTATLDGTPFGPAAALARQLAAGATTQWEVVARVHRYLLDGGRFRYATNLPQAGPFPLVDFLLRDHAGYCQHFAGAAALLLRLAGVPARVVVGFATGVPGPDGRFHVRDVDAHAWIEVYFQGSGWVAFNPTPPAAQANIPRQLDPLAPAATGGGHDAHGDPAGRGWLALGGILAALATVGVRVARRRTRRGPVPLGPLLELLVRRTGGQVQPSSTLAELGIELARLVGPKTAALAAQAERARFAPGPSTPSPRPRIQLAWALASDLGPRRALVVLITPAATRLARQRPL